MDSSVRVGRYWRYYTVDLKTTYMKTAGKSFVSRALRFSCPGPPAKRRERAVGTETGKRVR